MRLSPLSIIFVVVSWPTALFAFVQSSGELPLPALTSPEWSATRGGEQQVIQGAQPLERVEAILSPQRTSRDQLISLVFNETRLSEVIEQLKVETGLDIRLGDKGLGQKNVNIQIKRQRIEQALETIASQVEAYVQFDSARSIYFFYVGKPDKEAYKEPDHKVLERQINEAFPDSFVQLSKIGDQTLVRGQAKDFIEANQILKLIASFIPEDDVAEQGNSQTNQLINNPNGLQAGLNSLAGEVNSFSTRNQTSKVINLLSVPGSQQVMLRVTVAEVNRSAARSIGLNFLVRNGEDNLFRSAFGPAGAGDSFFGDSLSGGTIQALIDSSDVGLAIDALRDMSLAKTLSEPNLTTIHGQRAEFRAGGRFPVPVISGLNNAGTQGVQFIPFGVSLDFTPFILERDRILSLIHI